MVPPAKTAGPTDAQLRRWLGLIRTPDRLVGPEVTDLLRRLGRLPEPATTVASGRATRELLLQAIERLRPHGDSTRDEQLPYLVLKTCFVDGAKSFQAAGRLGMSERQMSRERSRAIALLRGELEAPAKTDTARAYRPEPIPAIMDYLPRPALSTTLRAALTEQHLVNIHGPPGVGKTSLVAELAAEIARDGGVVWYRFRAGVNDSLGALLYELGEYLRSRGKERLSAHVSDSLRDLDPPLTTRLALRELDGASHLVVFDDFHHVEEDRSITGLIEEMVARLPEIRLATISRHRGGLLSGGTALAVPPFTRAETRALLAHLRAEVAPRTAETIHAWIGGIPHLVKLAASWIKTATPEEIERGTASLGNQIEVQAFLLENITELIDPDDRAVLEAASIFRDRFADDALAYVSERSRGEVQDTSVRLDRLYIATRSRGGDCSFFHASVRDYVYERLTPERRRALHGRGARWYERQQRPDEAAHHARLSSTAGS